VKVSFADDDMPGHAKVRLKCDKCGEWVSDHRERDVNGQLLCVHCAEGGYYDVVSERVAIPA
jgi:formylmethanofuran dehydrogenase subunit E